LVRSSTSRLADETGSSLAEVSVAMVVLVLAVVPIVGMLEAGLRAATSSGEYDAARALANEKLEEVRALPYSRPGGVADSAVERYAPPGQPDVTLGLAVIVVVLIGVLAARLLAALRSDLESTTQANRGQRALHLADAGAQAAAAQLRADADPAHYDADDADNSGWAEVLSDGGPPGETLALNGGAASVTIRYPSPRGAPRSKETGGTRRRGSQPASPTTLAGTSSWPSPRGPSARRGARSRPSSTRRRPGIHARSSSGAGGRPTSRPSPPNFLTGP
jgi:Tfp pilus assembly protein PilV